MSNKDFYRVFEEKHRGSRELIKERVKTYFPFVLPLKELYSHSNALDIGCGRGEWLELLKENDISGEGIDFDEGMLQACRELNLQVREGDGLVYLKKQETESMSIITAFHVVENIFFEELQELVEESLRVLKPGGILILETPNPENIKVATENFYLDPTHVKPIPSKLLSFLTEFYGYSRTKVVRLQEPKDIINRENINLLDVLSGVSPDYAVVAQKSASENILKLFDNAFNQEIGISLVELSSKFETRFLNLEEKATQAEIRTNDALHHYHSVINSNSWKITKPLRLVKPMVKSTLKYIDRRISKIVQYAIEKKVNGHIDRPIDQRKKLLIDYSFIYTTGLNTGIQRVVRNIVNNIGKYAKENNLELVTVALVNGSIIKVDMTQKEKVMFNKKSKILNIIYKIKQKLQIHISSYKEAETVYKDDILLMLDSTWHLDIWPSVKYAKKKGVKIIGVTYDLIPISHPQFCDDNLVKLFADWYDKSLLYFDGYIAISKTVMLDVQKYLISKDVDISKYSFDYFHLGSDFKEIEKDSSKVRENLQILYNTNKSIYLIVSTIEPRKNHRYLFETFKKLWTLGIDVTLVIVGRVGWKTEDLIGEMKTHEEYQKRLWIFNDLDDNELNCCYKNSKALLFPSFVEGYGLPIIESLQNNLPVLASDTPIHREVGKDMIDYFDIGKSNELVNKIQAIEKDDTQLKKVDVAKVKILTWSESASELLKAILEILKTGENK